MKKSIRYELSPQMEVYDAIGQVWKPFIMYFTRPNFKSDVVNLDKFGLRFNNLNRKYDSIFDEKNF